MALTVLGRKKKPLWSPQLDSLDETEKVTAIAAVYYLKLGERGMWKAGIPPTKKSLAFEALVARMAGPDLGPADEQDTRDIYDVAHCLRDSRTVVAGSPIRNGPYGDLFHRALWGWGTVIDLAFRDRLGYAPEIDPIDTVEPPTLRLFLDNAVGRYADALSQEPMGTTSGRFPATLHALAERFGDDEPELVSALRGRPALVSGVQGEDYILPVEQYIDMTGDELLAEAAATAEPV